MADHIFTLLELCLLLKVLRVLERL
jgi:hypothetical protein